MRWNIVSPHSGLKRWKVLCVEAQNTNTLLVLKHPLQLENLPTFFSFSESAFIRRGCLRSVATATPISPNLTPHTVYPAHSFFFFHANFLVKITNGHLIKGQPSFIFLFSKEIFISSLAFWPLWENVTWQGNYWCISFSSFSSFSSSPLFLLLNLVGVYFDVSSLFNGIYKWTVEGIFDCLLRLSCW